MAVRGRPLKDNAVTRHVPQHSYLNVPNVPYTPTEEEARCPSRAAATRRWWAVVSTMPHCRLWGAGEWEFARATAYVHATFIASGGKVGAKELRDREKAMGTTEDARRALRIRYVEDGYTEPVAEGEEVKPVTPIEFDKARRDRLLAGG